MSAAHILLVEDNAEDAAATMQALRRGNLAGELHWVKDGEEALEYLFCTGRYSGRDRREPPRLVLDIWMPKVDGIEVLLQRGRTSGLDQVPVVVMTSCARRSATCSRATTSGSTAISPSRCGSTTSPIPFGRSVAS